MDKYYVCSVLPEPFRAADLLMAQQYPEPEYIREPKVVPMPRITENYGAEGPLHITVEWYENEQEKRRRQREKAQKEAEIEMIQLISRREMLRMKLGELDPSKSKDSKRIAAINIELKRVNSFIHQLEVQYGINATELDKGTRVGRFLGRIKKEFKKIKKKVKRFFQANAALIQGIASIILPVIGGAIAKKLLRL